MLSVSLHGERPGAPEHAVLHGGGGGGDKERNESVSQGWGGCGGGGGSGGRPWQFTDKNRVPGFIASFSPDQTEGVGSGGSCDWTDEFDPPHPTTVTKTEIN